MVSLPKIKLNRQNLALVGILIILVAIPLTVVLLGIRQELRKEAADVTEPTPNGLVIFSQSLPLDKINELFNTNPSLKNRWFLLQVSSEDPRLIKQELVNAFNQLPKVRYLMILGSEKTIPVEDTTGLVLPYIPSQSASNAVLDNYYYYYGDVDGDYFIDLAVGRIPSDDFGEIEDYFSRTSKKYSAKYLSVDETVFSRNLCLSENLGIEITLNSSKEDVINALTDGGVVGYENHGAADFWSVKDGFTSQDIPTLNNNPIILTGACESSAILGKNLIKKGALAYYGSWFSQPGRDVVDPIYRKLRQGIPLGEAVREYLNQQLTEFVVGSLDGFVGADFPSFRTVSIPSQWDEVRKATGSGMNAFPSGALLFGDPSITFPQDLTDGSNIEEAGGEIIIKLPSYKYTVDRTTEIGSDITICSSNKNNFYQARYSSLLKFPAPGEFSELQPLAFEVGSGWQAVNSATWTSDSQNINVPEATSNGFATLVKGKSQSYLLINDHLFGGNDAIGKYHTILISAQGLTPIATPTTPPTNGLKLNLLKVWFWKQEKVLGRGHKGTAVLVLKQGENVVLKKAV